MAAIAAPVPCEAGTVVVSASVGLASGPPGEVIKRADAALYEVKRAKRLPSTRRGSPLPLTIPKLRLVYLPSRMVGNWGA